MKKKIVISAYNIHQGGGKILLDALVKALSAKNADQNTLTPTLFLDSRYELTTDVQATIFRVKPTLIDRIKAEKHISQLTQENDILLCFGNLPPLFKSFTKTFVYVQTKYLVSSQFICWTNIRTAARTFFEKAWFVIKKSKKYTYFVQTASMKKDFVNTYGPKYNCEILGFAPHFTKSMTEKGTQKGHKLLYVSSGESHKNHANLFSALAELKIKGIVAPLTLTLDTTQYPEVASLMHDFKSRLDLSIHNYSSLPREAVLKLYLEHDALVFPSYFESFGLPLIEAHHFGLPIIASDRDFVRDVVDPVETFDPNSPKSIADSIERFLKSERQVTSKKTNIKTAEEFLWRLTNS